MAFSVLKNVDVGRISGKHVWQYATESHGRSSRLEQLILMAYTDSIHPPPHSHLVYPFLTACTVAKHCLCVQRWKPEMFIKGTSAMPVYIHGFQRGILFNQRGQITFRNRTALPRTSVVCPCCHLQNVTDEYMFTSGHICNSIRRTAQYQ